MSPPNQPLKQFTTYIMKTARRGIWEYTLSYHFLCLAEMEFAMREATLSTVGATKRWPHLQHRFWKR